tara:strand:- start:528 stop:797 length:270 start_codon:yes stop_codon:yes gene_type:complete
MVRVFKRDGVEYIITPDGRTQKQTYGDTTEFKNRQKKIKKAIEKAKKTPATSDAGYPIDYSKMNRKQRPKYKAKGGLIHGKPKLAKKGF